MKSLNEVDINVKDAFKVSVSIDGVGYSAANIKDLLRITPMSEGISIERLIDETKHTFAGDDGIPFQFHGLHMSVPGTHMLFLTLTGKVILVRKVVPYGDEVFDESEPQRYSYQVYDRVNYDNTFEWWLRDATASVSDYINLCKQLGISYVKYLD